MRRALPSDPVAPPDRRRRSQEVYDRLRRDISALRLPPGSVLHEDRLSERYEASRTPVREALFRLEQDGFLVRVGRQLQVKEFTFADVEELYAVREALEKMAVRLCIERATEAELDELQEQLDQYDKFDPASDYDGFNEHVNKFHRTIARLSHNHSIWRSLEAIHDKVLIINARPMFQEDEPAEMARRGHAVILQAIRDRDVTVAEAAVRAHIQGIVRLYRQANSQEATWEAKHAGFTR